MHIYLENDYLVSLKSVILITDYIHIKATDYGIHMFNTKEVIDLSQDNPKSVVITDKTVYLTSYGLCTLESRSNEFRRTTSKWRLE
ncbi:MAG: DUF370 domain-containing protein [Cetobacterium sp.]|uniref:extracellular matrix regulator RemB n=1 Tax=unclassified Cetobacterium TaxID=2630983 RepID=UPI00163B82EA|nr:DUF370 domain-containing protein [Cetobacterium sp. 2A]MBC2856225.1 DUF370 domain-containing protein [Cetobacterium sp. 2A]